MIVCPLCETVVETHRPNQVICNSRICRSRYTDAKRKGKPLEPRKREMYTNFYPSLFNEVLMKLEVRL